LSVLMISPRLQPQASMAMIFCRFERGPIRLKAHSLARAAQAKRPWREPSTRHPVLQTLVLTPLLQP
jgi:hypothetical protein